MACRVRPTLVHLISIVARSSFMNRQMQTNEISQAQIRRYNCRETIEQLLEAANWAPTHGKTEPWRWVVLSEDGLQDMIKVTDQVWPCQICQQHVIYIICIQAVSA